MLDVQTTPVAETFPSAEVAKDSKPSEKEKLALCARSTQVSRAAPHVPLHSLAEDTEYRDQRPPLVGVQCPSSREVRESIEQAPGVHAPLPLAVENTECRANTPLLAQAKLSRELSQDVRTLSPPLAIDSTAPKLQPVSGSHNHKRCKTKAEYTKAEHTTGMLTRAARRRQLADDDYGHNTKLESEHQRAWQGIRAMQGM